jgi:protein FrlC
MICFTPEQCIYPFNIASPDELLRRISVDYFLRCIEDAAGFGCGKIMLTPGWAISTSRRRKHGRDLSIL